MTDKNPLTGEFLERCAKYIIDQIGSAEILPSRGQEIQKDIQATIQNVKSEVELLGIIKTLKDKYPEMVRFLDIFIIETAEVQNQKKVKELGEYLKKGAVDQAYQKIVGIENGAK